MLAFLDEHLTPLHELLKEDTLYVRGPVADPSYGRDAQHQIGFDFTTSSQWQSRVAYMVCYWVAKRVPGTNVWYDGHEKIDVPKDCNDDGFHSLAWLEDQTIKRNPQARAYFEPQVKALRSLNPAVSGELARLTKLWK
jgi:hypothetical protein